MDGITPTLTLGEASVLVGQLVAMDPAVIGGWTLVVQDRTTLDIGIASSALTAETGLLRSAVIEMLLGATQQIVDEMDQS